MRGASCCFCSQKFNLVARDKNIPNANTVSSSRRHGIDGRETCVIIISYYCCRSNTWHLTQWYQNEICCQAKSKPRGVRYISGWRYCVASNWIIVSRRIFKKNTIKYEQFVWKCQKVVWKFRFNFGITVQVSSNDCALALSMRLSIRSDFRRCDVVSFVGSVFTPVWPRARCAIALWLATNSPRRIGSSFRLARCAERTPNRPDAIVDCRRLRRPSPPPQPP